MSRDVSGAMHPLGPQLGEFRAAAWVLVPICALPAVAAAPGVLRRLVMADDLSWLGVVVAILAIPVSAVLAYVLLRPVLSLFRIRVHELGISGHDAFGRRVSLAWPHMGAIEPIGVAALTWLKIATSDPRRALWLPRFLANQESFDALVIAYAGAGHPLTRSLREHD